MSMMGGSRNFSFG